MARTLRYLFVLLFTSIAGAAWAQTGEIYGTVTDERKEPLINASVIITEGGIQKWAGVTDYDGKYSAKPLSPGNYDVRVSYAGMKVSLIQDVRVTDGGVRVNATLEASTSTTITGKGGKDVEVVAKRFEPPLIEARAPGSRTQFTAEQIQRMPTRNVADVAALAPGVYQARTGGGLSVGGGRGENTLYIVDGVMVRGSRGINLTPGSIQSISVNSGGLPARYGDATGGVVTINTRGVSSKLVGSVFAEHSLDGYNHNQAGFSLSGPLLKRKDSTGFSKPVVGFSLAGDYTYDEDNNPSYYKNYVLKDEVRQQLEATPLRAVPGPTGQPTLKNASEFVTMDDLTTSKKRINAENSRAAMNGKLDFAVSDNANLTVGANGTYSRGKNYSRFLSLFSPDAIGTTENITGRGFLRFTQRFGKPGDKGTITNAFYQVQVDYQKDISNTQDPNFKKDIFRYGYVGKFYENRTQFYATGFDSISGRTLVLQRPEVFASNVRFARSEDNPILANYTSTSLDLAGVNPGSIRNIRNFNGLLNGDMPAYNFGGLWSNIGTAQNGYSKSNIDQFSGAVDASFDLTLGKTKHAIEFGLYFQQRAERSYGLTSTQGGQGTLSLWEKAYLLTNTHFLERLNTGNDPNGQTPYYIINGQRYTVDDVKSGRVTPSITDTVIYGYNPNYAVQSAFDENLRKKLGLNTKGTDYINLYELDPSQLSVDMFSADELINSGRSFVSYYGYDYTGKRLSGSVNFNDFFTQKDANGRYTRPIGAFRPNYMAGYISDNFTISDIYFNLGLRVDRYDANTKVLKDPYTLYDAYTVGELVGSGVSVRNPYVADGKTPSNIGSGYTVYVNDNNSSNPTIIGYRDGENWYDPTGRLVEDPTSLGRDFGGGRDAQPFLQKIGGKLPDIKDPNYDPNSSFTDYKPQVNVMPRLSFTFTIAEKTQFYGHYDVVVQRPSGFVYSTPIDYYYINQNSNQIISNPDLKPEKLFDYEVGFQQELTKRSAVTISGFYKERKDQIQIRPYLYAYPNTYYTFGNRDFSTTKGLRLKYDLRELGNLRMFVAYTLQFAEGTGSDVASSNRGRTDVFQSSGLLQNFISAQLPNMRFTAPLDIDSRHVINVNADYRFGMGKGPEVAGRRIFQNAGINLTATARSGEPYTRYADPVSNTVAGGLQGSRLPWHYMLNMRVEKDFDISFRKNKGTETRAAKPRYLTAFVYVKNLLNTKDVLNVYPFSSRPDNDGFLTSPQGQVAANAQSSPQSYIDLYSLSRMNPNNINLPRQINLGLQFNF